MSQKLVTANDIEETTPETTGGNYKTVIIVAAVLLLIGIAVFVIWQINKNKATKTA